MKNSKYKTIKLLVIIIIFSSIELSCVKYSYYLTHKIAYDQETSANMGGDMVVWQEGRQPDRTGYPKTGIEHRLVYGGLNGSTIKLYYVEFAVEGETKLLSRAAFKMSFEYDLSESKTIAYRNIEIKVVKATNKKIIFVVLKGPKQVIVETPKVIIYENNEY